MKQDWETKKLGEVLVKTETVDPTKKPNENFIYLDVSSVNKQTKKIENSTIVLGKDAPSRARKLVRTDDVIFATVRPTHGRVAVITEEYDEQVCSTGYFVLRGKDYIFNQYLFYFILTDEFNEQMEKLQKGASYPAVTDAQVRNILISFPKSLREQHSIVAILDKVFTAIDKAKVNAEQNLQNTKELYEVESVNLYTSLLNNTTDDELGNLAKLVRGPFGGSLTKSMFVEKGYAIYEQRNAIGQIADNFRYFIGDAKYQEMERFAVKGGDMLMSCSGTIGRFVVLNENPTKGVINQALLKISPDSSKIDTNYLLFVLKNFINSADSLTQGAAIKNIVAVKELKKISVPLPDLNTQKTVVDKINALSEHIDKLQSNYQQKINILEELKKSFLQKAFSGELNIPKEGVIV